jgi:hypothetical protein
LAARQKSQISDKFLMLAGCIPAHFAQQMTGYSDTVISSDSEAELLHPSSDSDLTVMYPT